MIPKKFALIPLLFVTIVSGIVVGGYFASSKNQQVEPLPVETKNQTLGINTKVNTLIINKIFTTPNAFQTINNKYNSQWIEIYNPNDEDVSLDNWSIHEGKSCDEFLGGLEIPKEGFAILTPATLSQLNSIWPISPGTVFAPISSAIGNGLEPNDTIILSSTPCEETVKEVDKVIVPQLNEGEVWQKLN